MRYHNITKDDMLNGDGLRAVLWVAGCGHSCPGCQNPVTWDPDGGLLFDEAARKELYAELEKDYISGVTLTGGDPMHPANQKDIEALVREIRELFPEKTIWMYTGDLWEDICGEVLIKDLDVVVDGEFHLSEQDNTLHWKGSANQRVIDVQQSLAEGMVVLHA